MANINNIHGLCDDGLLRVEDACKFMAISDGTLYRLTRSGELRYVEMRTKGGRGIRIPKRECIRYAEENLKGGWKLPDSAADHAEHAPGGDKQRASRPSPSSQEGLPEGGAALSKGPVDRAETPISPNDANEAELGRNEEEFTWWEWERRLAKEDPWSIAEEALRESGHRVYDGDLQGMWTCLIFFNDVLRLDDLAGGPRIAHARTDEIEGDHDHWTARLSIQEATNSYMLFLESAVGQVKAHDGASASRTILNDLWKLGMRIETLTPEESA